MGTWEKGGLHGKGQVVGASRDMGWGRDVLQSIHAVVPWCSTYNHMCPGRCKRVAKWCGNCRHITMRGTPGRPCCWSLPCWRSATAGMPHTGFLAHDRDHTCHGMLVRSQPNQPAQLSLLQHRADKLCNKEVVAYGLGQGVSQH